MFFPLGAGGASFCGYQVRSRRLRWRPKARFPKGTERPSKTEREVRRTQVFCQLTPVIFHTGQDGELLVLGVRSSGSTSSSAFTPRYRLEPGTMSLRISISAALCLPHLLSFTGAGKESRLNGNTIPSRRLCYEHGYGGYRNPHWEVFVSEPFLWCIYLLYTLLYSCLRGARKFSGCYRSFGVRRRLG